MDISLVFTNSAGSSVTISRDSATYKPTNVNTGNAISEHRTERAYNQDGSSYLDSLLGVRTITFGVLVTGAGHADLLHKMKELERAFNPKLGQGTLRYTDDYFDKEIAVVADRLPLFFPRDMGYNTAVCDISLTAHNPYFLDLLTSQIQLSTAIGGLSFPVTLPEPFSALGTEGTITNNGDVEAPLLITFFGPATTPKLTNSTTGEYIEVEQALLSGEYLEISTDPDNPYVIDQDGNNAYDKIELGSTLFQLAVGDNALNFAGSGGSPTVVIEYKQRWI